MDIEKSLRRRVLHQSNPRPCAVGMVTEEPFCQFLMSVHVPLRAERWQASISCCSGPDLTHPLPEPLVDGHGHPGGGRTTDDLAVNGVNFGTSAAADIL